VARLPGVALALDRAHRLPSLLVLLRIRSAGIWSPESGSPCWTCPGRGGTVVHSPPTSWFQSPPAELYCGGRSPPGRPAESSQWASSFCLLTIASESSARLGTAFSVSAALRRLSTAPLTRMSSSSSVTASTYDESRVDLLAHRSSSTRRPHW